MFLWEIGINRNVSLMSLLAIRHREPYNWTNYITVSIFCYCTAENSGEIPELTEFPLR